MSTLVGFRNFNRSRDIQYGDKTLAKTTGGVTYVNVDNPRVHRDIGRHAAIGGVYQVAGPHWQADDGVIRAGGKATVRATGLVVDVSAVELTSAAGTNVSGAAGTATIGTADGTNPRIDTIAVNTSTGAFVVVAGTATAGATLANRRGLADVPASRMALAWVLVPATATNLVQTNVADVRP